MVTAGPTREPLDPVRFLSNRSSGKMGYAIARRAVERGHEVRLVTGPVSLAAVEGALVIRVETALQMESAVRDQAEWYEALVMAAAVADWRPADTAAQKLKKGRAAAMTLRLVRNPDIVAGLAATKAGRIHVGFAAETEDMLRHARRKLEEKRLDLIVANDVSAPGSGFDVDTNRAILLTAGERVDLPLMAKSDLALRVVEWIEARAGTVSGELGKIRCF